MNSFWAFVGHFKDFTAILNPLLIAGFGIYINKTIQSQNRIAERRSALSKQWADEFSELTKNIYNDSVRVVIIYFQAVHREHYVSEESDSFFEIVNKEIRQLSLRLLERKLYLEKYIDLAPTTGIALSDAFDKLDQMSRKWFSSKGGNVEEFRSLQLAFNQRARDTHREILGLDRR